MTRPRGFAAAVAVVSLTMAITSVQTASVATTTSPTARGVSTSSRAATGVSAKTARHIDVTRWGVHALRRGTFERTRLRGGIVVGRRPAHVAYRDPFGHRGHVAYDRGRWYSPWVRPGFGLSELIASYNAKTPVGTFIEVSARGRSGSGRVSSWDSLGRWASHDVRFHRMSLGTQGDDLSRVAVDTLVTRSGVTFARWQLRVSLMRRTGAHKTPVVTTVGAMASRLPAGQPRTSRPRSHRRHSLDVPQYSQEIHQGEYPRYNGGGEAWCSPTSTSMVVAYWHRGPRPRQYAWVSRSYRQPWVDYAARYTYASAYDGTGDWPFNTAYAGRFGLDSFVTRLRSLREAELFIKAGIPLVASISFGPGELHGAPIGSTNGHLLVIRGFTSDGRVIVNDPAAQTAKAVKRVYRRGEFERAWVGSTGGVVYVIHPHSRALPDRRHHQNW